MHDGDLPDTVTAWLNTAGAERLLDPDETHALVQRAVLAGCSRP